MRKIFGIGETVFDILFRDEQPVSATPGGSTFNSMVSLGRCGVPAVFLSEVGDDRVGEMTLGFLERNGVDAGGVHVCPGMKSTLSLAFLDARNDARYTFYKDRPHDCPAFDPPEAGEGDLVLFGSFYAVNPELRSRVGGFLEYARSRGAVLYYDVNFRPSHEKDREAVLPNFFRNIELADFVRGSREDFLTLFGMEDCEEVFREKISGRCPRFLFTRGADPVTVLDAAGFRKSYPVRQTETVSTIGAGDNFNAGFLFGLLKEGITRRTLVQGLSEAQWDSLVDCAGRFSSECCRNLYNYVSPAFAAEMRLFPAL